MNRLLLFALTYIIVSIVIVSCGTPSAPTGGLRDERPPMLLSTIPQANSLNYGGTEIQLEFDEWVNLNNITKELIITPRINSKFEAKYKKNKVYIKLEQPLDSNTTYTFNFRNGIKDLTEGNVPENLKLTFSTGSYLDSLTIFGTASNLYTNKTTRDISISLYAVNDTMNVFDDPPLYLTKTNEEGEFLLENLKQGDYLLYAFQDNNKNLSLQTSSEAYAFYADTIKLDSIYKPIHLSLFNLNMDTLKLQNARASGPYFVLKYNKHITQYNVETIDTTKVIYSSVAEEGKGIQFYNTLDNITDSIQVITKAIDSVNYARVDTLFIKFQETKREKDKYSFQVTTQDLQPNNPILDVDIKFNKPSNFLTTDSIFLYIDSLTIRPIDSIDYSWNHNKTQLDLIDTFSSELLQPKPLIINDTSANPKMTAPRPQLYLGKGAFHSVENDSTKQSTSILKISNIKDAGIIKVNTNTNYHNYKLQLLDKNNKTVVELPSNQSHSYSFKNLKAGDYKIRALVDLNNNGLWDLGNIYLLSPAEPAFFYKSAEGNELITLRANWELGPLNFQF